MYSPLPEHSTALTCPSGVPLVGQLAKAVPDGTWIILSASFLALLAMQSNWPSGLKLRLEIAVVRFSIER
jgi:hypothetical protein